MTVSISPNGEHRHDQSSGIQSAGILDKDDVILSADLNELPDVFEAFLLSLVPLGLRENAADYDAAHEDPDAGYFIDVTASGDETLEDLYFSTSDGSLFDGEIATYDGGTEIHVVGSTDPIYLYSFADGDILIGSTDTSVDISDPSTLDGSTIVFAYYLDENASHTGADVWGVTFQPLDHPIAGDDSGGEHDDAIDFGDFLHVSASASLSFAFDTLESGKFLWVAVGDSDNGLLVTGRDLNVQDLGSGSEGDRVSGGSDSSDAVNTSQGGTGATIGINNQQWVPGNEGVFTFVKGLDQLGAGPDATGDNVLEIDYDDDDPYINTEGAGLFISQKQGSPAHKLDMTIRVWEAGGGLTGDTPENLTPEEGFDYIGAEGPPDDGTSGAFDDDHAVAVETVTIVNGTFNGGSPAVFGVGTNTIDGVTVTISGNVIEVDGVDEFFTISWTVFSGTTFNRFTLEADDGKFDVGRVDLSQGVLITEAVGDEVIIHDDGPSFGAQVAAPVLITDDTDITDVDGPTSFVNVFTPDFGADGFKDSDDDDAEDADAVTYALGVSAENGVDSGLVDTISGDSVYLYLEGGDVVGRVGLDDGGGADATGAVVFTISVVTNTGMITQTQDRSVIHDDPLDHDEGSGSEAVLSAATLITLTATATDGDGDTATDTANIGDSFKFKDDGPIAQITDTGVVVVHDENDGLQTGGTPDLLTGEDNNDDDEALPLPATLLGVLTQGTGVTGWAKSSSAVVNTTGTDFGTDGAATVDSIVWSLDIPTPDTTSGFVDLNGNNILLNEEIVDGQEVIVGRVAGGANDGLAAIAIIIDQSGFLSVAQYLPIFHSIDPTDPGYPLPHPDDVEVMLDGALQAVLTVTDGDGDTHVDTEDIGDKVRIEDAGPLGTPLATKTLEEDDLDGSGTELSVGNDQDTLDGPAGDSSGLRETATVNVEEGVSSTGVDQPVSFTIDTTIAGGVLAAGVLPDLYSKGEKLTYVLTHGATQTDPDTIEAFADYGGSPRLVWTFTLTDAGDGTADAVFVLNDQLDHAPFGDDSEGVLLLTDPTDPDNSSGTAINQIDFTDLLALTDADGDPVALGNEFVTFEIQDDTPVIAELLNGSANPISDGLVDFTTITGANPEEADGTSVHSVSNSLNGLIGTDENNGSDETAEGIKTYTFASYSTDTSVIAGLQSQLIEDDTKVVYFTDGDSEGNVAGVFDGNDSLFYDIVLGDQGGSGDYTFTVYQNPPPSILEFDFSGLPSNQSLFGMIPGSLTDPEGRALLIMPAEPDLDLDGTYSNTSKTINTSKGGGNVTIGIKDQMFDGYGKTDKDGDGDGGAFFVFVEDPDQDILAGLSSGLSGVYDDADNIGFGSTFETTSAQFSVVQNSTSMEARVTAYDINPVGRVGDPLVDPDVGTDARDFISDPLATDAQVSVTEIMVYAEDGVTLLEHVVNVDGVAVLQDINASGAGDDDDPTVSITFEETGGGGSLIYSADIAVNLHDSGYTFTYVTAAPHDAVQINAVNDPEESTGNKFDIGAFNILEAQPTPDQKFDFTVDITDFDGDMATSNEFSIGVDGTGTFDDDAETDVLA